MIRKTQKDVIEIHTLLKEHLVVAEDGFSDYAEGWSSERVAERVGPDRLTARHIESVLKDFFPPLRPKMKVSSKTRLAALEARTAALEARVATLEKVARHANLPSTKPDPRSESKVFPAHSRFA